MPEHGDLAARRVHETEQHPDEGGLAAAVRAEEAVAVALAHVQADVTDRVDVAEALGQVLCRDHLAWPGVAKSTAAACSSEVLLTRPTSRNVRWVACEWTSTRLISGAPGDRFDAVGERHLRRARSQRVVEQPGTAAAAPEGEHRERGQPLSEHADLRDGRRLPREPGEAAGKRRVVQVFQHADEAARRGGGEPGARPVLRGQHAGVGCPRARLEKLGFQRGPRRAAAEQLYQQRQPGSGRGPDVGARDRGLRAGRRDLQPGRTLPGDAPGRQEGQPGSRPRFGDDPDGQGRRHQVGGPGQPDDLRPVDPGEQLLAGVPDEGIGARLVRVVLPGVGERVHPPVLGRGLPDPHPGHPVEQLRHAGESGQRGQAEGRVAFRVTSERHALGAEDAVLELPRGELLDARREGAGQYGQTAEHGYAGQHG